MAETDTSDPRRGAAGRLLGSDLAGDTAFLLARARAVTSGSANARLAALDLKVRSLSALWLACDGLRPTQRELSEFLGLDPSQVVGLVDDLQRRGLVVRRPDDRDRRSRVIEATPDGRRVLRRGLAAARAAGEATLGHLSDDERTTLSELLTKVAFGGSEPPSGQD